MGLGGKRISCYDLANSVGDESPTGTALGADENSIKRNRTSSCDEKEGGMLVFSLLLLKVRY